MDPSKGEEFFSFPALFDSFYLLYHWEGNRTFFFHMLSARVYAGKDYAFPSRARGKKDENAIAKKIFLSSNSSG